MSKMEEYSTKLYSNAIRIMYSSSLSESSSDNEFYLFKPLRQLALLHRIKY